MSDILPQEKTSFVPVREKSREFRAALAQFPTGVTIVTCNSEIGPLGVTANSFTGVSIDPALIMWCPTKSSKRYNAFMSAEHFAVHVMPVEKKELCLAFSRSGQAFDDVDWRFSAKQVPLLDCFLARFECSRFADYDGGDHSLLLGLVEKASVVEGVPLSFSQGGFNAPENKKEGHLDAWRDTCFAEDYQTARNI